MGKSLFAALALAAVAFSGVSAKDHKAEDLELVKLIIMNRHGHRAPNLPFWTLCPAEKKHQDSFGTYPEDLTSRGFDEEYRCGKMLRRDYGDFISKLYDRTKHYVQAVGEPRTLQSAAAIESAVWPAGYGAAAGLPHAPQFPPIYSDLQQHEFLINDIPCKGLVGTNSAKWLATKGMAIAQEPRNAAALKKVEQLCHSDPEAVKSVSFDMLIKFMVDGVIFTQDFGIKPLGGKVDEELFFTLRNLSHTFLFGKLYDTDVQKTYYPAEFPHFMLKAMTMASTGKVRPRLAKEFHDNEPLALQTETNLYVGHREELYGLAFFWGMEYSCEGMARGEVPAGSTFLFELLREKKCEPSKKKPCAVYFRPKLWTPRDGTLPVTMKACKNPHLCTHDEMQSIYDVRTKRTGTWDKICGFKP